MFVAVEGLGCRLSHFFDRHLDAQFELGRGASIDDFDRPEAGGVVLLAGCRREGAGFGGFRDRQFRATEELCRLFDRALGRGKSDALQGADAGVLLQTESFQTFETEHQMRASLGG